MKLFRKRKQTEVINDIMDIPADKVVIKGKTTQELIDEIHENFYTEVDKLLASAKIKTIHNRDEPLIEKGNRLRDLGFTGTTQVKDFNQEVRKMEKANKENVSKEDLIEAINYFSEKYPTYKFITEASVKKICQKYGLVYGEVSNFTGFVPEKNLKHIEEFKMDDSDACYAEITSNGWSDDRISYMSKSYIEEEKKRKRSAGTEEMDWRMSMMSTRRTWTERCSLEIAAPIKDFNTEGMEIKDFKLSKIEIPDPVVLQPVYYRGEKHYLIVTAWGDEASDELVVNQKMN